MPGNTEPTKTNARPKGLALWTPKAKTLPLLAQVEEILAEYEAYLPMTNRQISGG